MTFKKLGPHKRSPSFKSIDRVLSGIVYGKYFFQTIRKMA
jgi:hypothetical protein